MPAWDTAQAGFQEVEELVGFELSGLFPRKGRLEPCDVAGSTERRSCCEPSVFLVRQAVAKRPECSWEVLKPGLHKLGCSRIRGVHGGGKKIWVVGEDD